MTEPFITARKEGASAVGEAGVTYRADGSLLDWGGELERALDFEQVNMYSLPRSALSFPHRTFSPPSLFLSLSLWPPSLPPLPSSLSHTNTRTQTQMSSRQGGSTT